MGEGRGRTRRPRRARGPARWRTGPGRRTGRLRVGGLPTRSLCSWALSRIAENASVLPMMARWLPPPAEHERAETAGRVRHGVSSRTAAPQFPGGVDPSLRPPVPAPSATASANSVADAEGVAEEPTDKGRTGGRALSLSRPLRSDGRAAETDEDEILDGPSRRADRTAGRRHGAALRPSAPAANLRGRRDGASR
jgi:hypothetical protein